MSILINGMEMPERCWDCDLCYDSFYCRPLEIQFSDREDFEPGERRLSDCPLVPIPPHGRCIDADALTISTAVPLDRKPYQYVHIDNIKGAPTIIPAEEVE